MKKLVLMLAVAFSMTMFSCTNNAEKAEAEAPVEEAVEVVTEEVAAPVAEATECDSCQNNGECAEAAATEAPAAETPAAPAK